MRDSVEKPMLLAPAGSANALRAAVFNGADAVYLGLNKFNARLKAENFSLENISDWISFCHLFGVKVYVTVNTSLKKDELEEAKAFVKQLADLKADGIIVTDPALLCFCSSHKGIKTVASTQLNVHNVFGAETARKLGADVAVLSRETPYDDICDINSRVDIETECFLHGALCVCISGQCYLSSFVDGNSGNRGLCAQPCRQLYRSFGDDGELKKSGYLLSAKDLCGVHTAKRLSEAGVSIFKIEGRNRREQYVGQTCAVYRKILDNDYECNSDDIKQLKIAFNRGDFTSGYLNNSDNIIYPQFQGHKGIDAGVIKKVDGRFVIESNMFLHEGDSFKIFRGNEETGNCVAASNSSRKFTDIKFSGYPKEGDHVNLTSSAAMNYRIAHAEKRIEVSAEFIVKAGEYPLLKLSANGCSVQVKGKLKAQRALTQPLSEAQIEELLSKTGQTEFTITNIIVKAGHIFLPKSSVNELRREAIEELRAALLDSYDKKRKVYAQRENIRPYYTQSLDLPYLESSGKVICQVKNADEFLKIKEFSDWIVFKPEDYSVQEINEFSRACKDFYLDMPNFAVKSDLSILSDIIEKCGVKGIVANNLYALGLAEKYSLDVVLGLGLNIFNRESACILGKGLKVKAYFASQELSLKDIRRDMSDAYIFAGGEITVMTVAHCPIKVNFGNECKKCGFQRLFYRDKTGRSFAVKRKRVARCYFEIENCVPLNATRKIDFPGRFFLKFGGDVEEIKHFALLAQGCDDGYRKNGQFTSGHLTNSVK